MRNISNSREAVKKIQDTTGLTIDVLSGEEEARLDFQGASFEKKMERGIMVDIGGGSTEIVSFEDGNIKDAVSLEIGSLYMYKNYVSGLFPDKGQSYKKMIGIGGTIRGVKKPGEYRFETEKEQVIRRSDLSKLIDECKDEERQLLKRILRVSPDRIHTLIPGMLILDVIYTQNRELSWLRFNERVLEEALEKDVPAFEKLKFISIFTSNLDEFFMIRVGSLYDRTFLPKPQKDNKTGMTAEEQLDAIFKSSAALYKKRDRIYKDVTAELAGCGIKHMKMSELGDKDRKYIEEYFTFYIQPVLSPQIVSTHHPFPHLVNKGLYTAVLLQINDTEAFGIIPVPQSIGRIIRLPGDGMKYVLTENIVTEYADRIFDNCKVTARSTVSITRNADINVSSLADEDEDFRHHMKKLLKKRSRLEAYLAEKLGLRKKQIFPGKAPLEMSYVFGLLDMLPKNMVPSVTYEPFSGAANILRRLFRK